MILVARRFRSAKYLLNPMTVAWVPLEVLLDDVVDGVATINSRHWKMLN